MADLQEMSNSGDGDVKPSKPRRKFVLCFDGTGNKFKGTGGDSNSEYFSYLLANSSMKL
jgi:hypothetical protein